MKKLSKTTVITAALGVAAVFFFLASAGAAAAPDTTPPTGTVSGVYSPATGKLELSLDASDAGWGLANAEASLDGALTVFVRLGAGACPEHPTPGDPEPVPGTCPESVSAVPLVLNTRAVANGEYWLSVQVTDAAGNTATLVKQRFTVRNTSETGNGKTVATLKIGVGNQGSGENGGGGSGGESPAPRHKRSRCRAPQLKMRLARNPLWFTRLRHVPVLHYGRRYIYRGRLTCLSSSRHRVSAPKGTRVGVFYRVWQRSFQDPQGPVRKLRRATLKVRQGGRLKIKLGFRSGRTVMFRYHDPGGAFAVAKLRLAVPPPTRRPPWGPR